MEHRIATSISKRGSADTYLELLYNEEKVSLAIQKYKIDFVKDS